MEEEANRSSNNNMTDVCFLTLPAFHNFRAKKTNMLQRTNSDFEQNLAKKINNITKESEQLSLSTVHANLESVMLSNKNIKIKSKDKDQNSYCSKCP